MNVYLAAPYAARAQARRYAAELTRLGYNVTSSWLEETHEISDGTTGAAAELDDAQIDKHARDDLADIESSDLLVVLTESASELVGGTATSGGRHVETGYAISMLGRTSIVVVGEPENVFHRLNGVVVVPTWHEAILELAARLVTRERAMPQAVCRG
jgi:nucleoside 2-deoxyribosyltransferase